jgi:hypothetical protein
MESSSLRDAPAFRWKWSTPSDHGVRLLALENSDFVFIERTQSNRNLSADLARKISDLGAVAAQSSVILVNDEERVEALVDLAQNAELLPSDFSIICVIGIAPRLTAGIGALKRRTQIANGLWIVSFAHVNENNSTRDILERYVLGPWIERRSERVLTHLSVPSDVHAPGSGAAWECKLVSRRFHSHRLHSPPSDTHFKKGGRVRIEKFGTHHLENVLRNALVHSTVTPDLVKGADVKTAANALDSLYESLERSDSVKPIATEEHTVDATRATPDAMQRSIALRERLQAQVKFVTSAQWAKWRGIQSNPAAALGKYKKQNRVFAVRFSKQDRYPAFQFAGYDAQPLPVIHDILGLIPQAAHGWPLLSWFEAKNTLLADRKPSEVVATEPEAALKAAQRFYSRDD